MKEKILTVLAIIGIIILVCGLSWLGTCGIIKLITLCFDLDFSWKIATGIWLILFLLSQFFTGGRTINRRKNTE